MRSYKEESKGRKMSLEKTCFFLMECGKRRRQRNGGEPSYAGLIFGNEESTSFFSLGKTEVLEDEPMVMPLQVQDVQGAKSTEKRVKRTGVEEDVLLRVLRNWRRSQAKGSGEVLDDPVATCSGKTQTKALLCRHLRAADIDFWLSLVSTSFKTFSKLHEGFLLLLVEMHLESGDSVCGNAGHGGKTKLHGPAWAPSKTSFPAPRNLDQ